MPGNPPTPMGSASSMQEAGVSYNTSWMRYAHGRITLDGSVENTWYPWRDSNARHTV